MHQCTFRANFEMHFLLPFMCSIDFNSSRWTKKTDAIEAQQRCHGPGFQSISAGLQVSSEEFGLGPLGTTLPSVYLKDDISQSALVLLYACYCFRLFQQSYNNSFENIHTPATFSILLTFLSYLVNDKWSDKWLGLWPIWRNMIEWPKK